MATQVVIVIYVLVGCGAAIAVLSENWRIGTLGGKPGAMLMLLFWPFLLPSALFEEESARPRPRPLTTRAARINELLVQLTSAWKALQPGGSREEALLVRFVAQLHDEEAKLVELDGILRDPSPRIAERLRSLRAQSDEHVRTGLEVLEDMSAQVTLLRFSERRDDSDDARVQVEHLLSRVEALADIDHSRSTPLS